MKRTYIISASIAFVVTGLTLGFFTYFQNDGNATIQIEHIDKTPSANAVYSLSEDGKVIPLDFTLVAEKVMDAVVHIKSTQTYTNNQYSNPRNNLPDLFRSDPFRDFFFHGEPPANRNKPQVRVGQGSGVIISDKGYIVTNNHVVAEADDIEVTLHDNRTYKGTVIGTDPTTDIALIQIRESNLASIPFVNSDEVKVGEWVMAVGNPFNLTSTVTAGIVSAKGRNINILKEQFAVESFIQTDAAINQGNSGGALVNLQGGLIGINTAIASPTGTYSGYGFAVPANIVNKVVEDLMKYGVVQRGVLGVMIRTVDGNLMKQRGLEVREGALIDSLLENSAAGKAGIQIGDVITSVGDHQIKSSPELQERIARHRPGDVVQITVDRQGNEKIFNVTLNNRKGNTEIAKKEHNEILEILGADLEAIDKKSADRLKISGGLIVKKLYPGKLRRNTNMKEGFIITKVNGKKISSVDGFISELEGKNGGVMLEGVYEDIPGEHYYAFGLNNL